MTSDFPKYRGGEIETASRKELRAYQEKKLRRLVDWLYERCPFWQKRFKEHGVRFGRIRTLEDLAALPYITKAVYAAEMDARPPYGEFLCYPREELLRNGAIVYRTTGTTGKPREFINSHEGFGYFGEQGVRNMWLAGVRPGDFVMGTFPMSLWAAGWGYCYGCRASGITFLAGGPPYDTRMRLEIIFDYRPAAVILTPSYALSLARTAQEHGLDLRKSGVRALIMGGESFPESRRRTIEEQWGIPGGARDFSGITEGGPIYLGAECEAQDGMHLHEDFAIFEFVKIGGTEPVGPGELGELVFTSLDQRAMGISFHYRTGDVVRYTDEPCRCGRTSRRFRIEGRVDDMVKVRGINIFPSAIEDLVRKLPELSGDFMLLLERRNDADEVTVQVEPVPDLPASRHEDVRAQLEERIRRALTIRVPVAMVSPGSLPRFELKAKRWIDRRPKA